MRESTLHKKLVDIRSTFGAIEKTGTNTGVGDGYKFVEASHISSRFLVLLHTAGVTMVCTEMKIEDIRPTPSGKQITYTLWTRWTLTEAETGETLEVEAFGQGADNGDKALPKAQTNAMKYAILLLLQRAGDDPEADGKTDKLESSATAAQARTAARRAAAADPNQGSFPAEAAPVPQTAPVPQAVEQPAPVEQPRAVKLASEAKRKAIRAKGHEVKLNDFQLKALSAFLVGEKSSKEWTDREADKIMAGLDRPDYVSMFIDAAPAPEAVPA